MPLSDLLSWVLRGLEAIPNVLAIIAGVRDVLDKGGATADELRAAIDAARARHASQDAADVLREELRKLDEPKG